MSNLILIKDEDGRITGFIQTEKSFDEAARLIEANRLEEIGTAQDVKFALIAFAERIVAMPSCDAAQFQNRPWRSRIEEELREFEKLLAPDPPPNVRAEHWKPFQILVADEPFHPEDGWTQQMSRARDLWGYPKNCGGVYLHIDYCSQDNVRRIVTGVDFAVIRWIGYAKKFCTEGPAKVQRGKNYDYRLKVIIPFHDDVLFLGAALEKYLLARVNTSDNDNDRFALRGGWIFDERSA